MFLGLAFVTITRLMFAFLTRVFSLSLMQTSFHGNNPHDTIQLLFLLIIDLKDLHSVKCIKAIDSSAFILPLSTRQL